MINVGIVSSHPQAAFNMATVVCKTGARCERLPEYSFNKIKNLDIVIFDLDNIAEWTEQIKKDYEGFANIVAVGFSRSVDTLDEFRPLMKVIRKPFRNEHVLTCISDLKNIVKEDAVINTEETPIYTKTGEPTAEIDELNTDVFSDEEMSKRLAKIINEKYNGPSEQQFLKQIGLEDIVIPEPPKETIVAPRKIVPDFTTQFVDDALLMYRAKKLRQQRLNAEEVRNRVKALMLFDASKGKNSSLVDAVSLEQRLDRSDKLSEETLHKFDVEEPQETSNSSTKTTFKQISINIEDQRNEAIGPLEKNDKVSVNAEVSDNFSEQELKYLKQDAEQSLSDKEPKTSSSAQQNNAAQKVVMDKAELSKKLQGTMSPEQIEKLKKLGVKI